MKQTKKAQAIKGEWVVDLEEGEIRYKGYTVIQLTEKHIHISLYWLRYLGFKGNVVVSEDFVDKHLLDRQIQPKS